MTTFVDDAPAFPSARAQARSGRAGASSAAARKSLNASAVLWFIVAVLGQLMFAYYIVVFYGGSALQGNFAAWKKVLPVGIVNGDTIGNAVLASHILLAAILTIGGPLQLIPQVRARVPTFHHWNGRVYLLTAVVAALTGLNMVWSRPGVVGDVAQHLGTSFNAVLIVLCAAMALRYALARDFVTHRRWALRLFLVVSGVWFFRVGLMLWLIINKGPVGFDIDNFTGPFLSFLTFAQTLLPLLVLEMYFRTQDRAGTSGRYAMAALLLVLTIAMGAGIFGATMGMWLPRV